MIFCSLGSGSAGNCQYIEYNNTKILVDAGMSGKKIEGGLAAIDVDIKDIDAIFVTHEHIDHSKGVGILSRRHNLKVFANKATLTGMLPITKEIKAENIYLFENQRPFVFKDLSITPFNSKHDCLDGTCFSIIGDKKVSIVTDTGYLDENMLNQISNSDIYYIEANYDQDMLKNSFYPRSLKNRISSKLGHLNNEASRDILKKLLKKKKELVMLGHLSKENNSQRIAARTVRDGLAEKNIQEGIDYILEIAPRETNSRLYKL